MFHLNPSSFQERRSITMGWIFSRLRVCKPKVLYSVPAIVCRLRVLKGGITAERELDWEGRIRQKLIYGIIHTEYIVHKSTIHYRRNANWCAEHLKYLFELHF